MWTLLLIIPAAIAYGLFGVFCLLLLRIPVRLNWIALFTMSGVITCFIIVMLFLWVVGDTNGKLPSASSGDAMFSIAAIGSLIASLTSVIFLTKSGTCLQATELHQRRKQIKVSIILVFILSLVPSINRTVEVTRTAHNLIIFAQLEKEDITFNPYSRNGYFINQDIAVWILKTFEYPYCSEFTDVEDVCGTSLIAWIGRGLDMHGEDSQKRGYELLDYFILRKEPIDSLNGGLAPIHEAILSRNTKYLKVLLSANADPNVKVSMPGKDYDGFDAYEYLNYLEGKGKSDFSEIRNLLVR